MLLISEWFVLCALASFLLIYLYSLRFRVKKGRGIQTMLQRCEPLPYDTCPVCWEPLIARYAYVIEYASCLQPHPMCLDCLEQIVRRRLLCPVCRARLWPRPRPLTLSELHSLRDRMLEFIRSLAHIEPRLATRYVFDEETVLIIVTSSRRNELQRLISNHPIFRELDFALESNPG